MTKDNMVVRLCSVCTRSVIFEGRKARAQHKAAYARYGNDLCHVCAKAHDCGRYEYTCKACDAPVSGTLEELRPCIDVNGHTFCRNCMEGFYGPYRSDNEALRILIDLLDESRDTMRDFARKESDKPERSYAELVRYQNEVRRLSLKNLRDYPSIVNPHNHPIGSSKAKGNYQLDHIVPVSLCFKIEVPVVAAASVQNLQVIPWFVNASRNSHFDERKLIGWPGLPAPPLRITRTYIIQD